MNLALTQAALIRRQQQVAKDVFTLLESLSEWTVMHAAPELADALERLAKFASTGDRDADAALEKFTGLREKQAAETAGVRGRMARIADAEEHESWCIAHRQPVRWQPNPCWWYHHPPVSGVPESSRCPAMWSAKAPRVRAA